MIEVAHSVIHVVVISGRISFHSRLQILPQHLYLGGRGKLEIRYIRKELLQQLNHHHCEIPQNEAMSLSQLKDG